MMRYGAEKMNKIIILLILDLIQKEYRWMRIEWSKIGRMTQFVQANISSFDKPELNFLREMGIGYGKGETGHMTFWHI